MRPLFQEDIAAPLSPEERARLLGSDLPYRLYHLRDAIQRVPAKSPQDNQAFEAGAVAGRVLLEFLGVGYDNKRDCLCESRGHSRTKSDLTDDVKVVDLDGTYVSVSNLPPEDQAILAKFIRGVHKACAHLTIGSEHQLTAEIFQDAGPIILRLYETHAPKT